MSTQYYEEQLNGNSLSRKENISINDNADYCNVQNSQLTNDSADCCNNNLDFESSQENDSEYTKPTCVQLKQLASFYTLLAENTVSDDSPCVTSHQQQPSVDLIHEKCKRNSDLTDYLNPNNQSIQLSTDEGYLNPVDPIISSSTGNNVFLNQFLSKCSL